MQLDFAALIRLRFMDVFHPRWDTTGHLTVGQTRSTQIVTHSKNPSLYTFLVQKTVLGMSNFPSETGVSGYLLSYDKLDPVRNLCTFWDVGVFRVSLSDAGDAFLEKWLRDPPVLSASPLEGEDDLICKRKSMAVGCLQEGNQRKGLLNFSLSSFVRIKIVFSC